MTTSQCNATSEPLWTPRSDQIADLAITRFAELARSQSFDVGEDYESLWQWSVNHRDQFWRLVWDFCGVKAGTRGDRVLVEGDRIQDARWFPDALLNFAENLLRRRDDQPAIISWDETGRRDELTFAALFARTARLAHWLLETGIQPGDRVAAMTPNIPETVVVMLAAASLGATFCSCSPDFGVSGAVDRFGQIAPRVLFAADGYVYGGKSFHTIEKAAQILDQVPSIEKCVLIPSLNPQATVPPSGKWTTWDEATSDDDSTIDFLQLPFNHPLYILFSSGTTGVPKCIVHGAGGTLLQHLKEQILHTNLGQNDRLFYFTTTGWMMWNWLVSGLAVGSTLVLFDGSPFHATQQVLWDMVDAEGVTVFGTSSKYLSAAEKAGVRPADTHCLQSLRTILSTGSPLLPESFDYVYRDIKRDVCLSSISGGTDIVSCFVLGNPALPVHRGEIQVRGLGMKVEVLDEKGRACVGQKGELVCSAAFPSMPNGFWNDPDGRRYEAAYFERYPGVWRHGDYAELTSRGGMIIYGRSDAVLNPGGVRIGTAEIYRQVEQIPEVLESIAIGQLWRTDIRIVLFVRLRDGTVLNESLRRCIQSQIRAGASPRHVPAKILQVADIPRTRSGKIVELAVADVVHGRPVKNTEALANPAALELFVNRTELNDD